ncbi:hypothetical protein Cni_G24004 [Canna indica]|uniref:Uncharacterized protein n=1 Tax=Canna indica TaxID=4628 RepID=A0AAQ3QMR3_9LILI|nr:hypothetical protein Cni_G24004 [Canna indica]
MVNKLKCKRQVEVAHLQRRLVAINFMPPHEQSKCVSIHLKRSPFFFLVLLSPDSARLPSPPSSVQPLGDSARLQLDSPSPPSSARRVRKLQPGHLSGIVSCLSLDTSQANLLIL